MIFTSRVVQAGRVAHAGRVRRAVVGIALACGAIAGLAFGCGPAPRSPAAAAMAAEPHWEDAFRPLPPVLFAFRPSALQSDPLYGPLSRRALALVRMRSRTVASTHALDAVEDADEVVCGIRPAPGQSIDDADLVAAIIGVHADVDPAAVVDSNGRAVWGPGPLGRVRELVRAPSADGAEPASDAERATATSDAERAGASGGGGAASLFELPGRTWVIASGDEVPRVRDTFARPRPTVARPLDPSALDPSALALLRLDGPRLLSRMLHAAARGGPLEALASQLVDAEVELRAGSAGVLEARVFYADAASRVAAEAMMRDTIGAFQRMKPEGLAWIGAITVGPPAEAGGTHAVTLSIPLPNELTAALRGVGGVSGADVRSPGNTGVATDAGARTGHARDVVDGRAPL